MDADRISMQTAEKDVVVLGFSARFLEMALSRVSGLFFTRGDRLPIALS